MKRKKPLQTQKEAAKQQQAAAAAGTSVEGGQPQPVGKPKKKEYTPFPPSQPPRKIDLQIESGGFESLFCFSPCPPRHVATALSLTRPPFTP